MFMCQCEKELQLPFYLVDIIEAAAGEEMRFFSSFHAELCFSPGANVSCSVNMAREVEDACKWSQPTGTIIFMSVCWHKLSLMLKICGFLDSSLCPVAYRSNTFTTQSVKSMLPSQAPFLLMWQLFIGCTAKML